MIVALTASSALDITYDVSRAQRSGDILVAAQPRLTPAGKGVNVALNLHFHGYPVVAIAGADGYLGAVFSDLVACAAPKLDLRTLAREPRINLTLVGLEPNSVTKINSRGAVSDRGYGLEVVRTVTTVLSENDVDWLVIAGSIPPGLDDLVSQLTEAAHRADVRCGVDLAGTALELALKCGVDLVSPNLAELAEIFPEVVAEDGESVSVREVMALAARAQVEILLSLGDRGALWTNGSRLVRAEAPVIDPINPTGAGDALLAGFLASTDDSIPDRLHRAIEWATAVCLSETAFFCNGIADSELEIRMTDLVLGEATADRRLRFS